MTTTTLNINATKEQNIKIEATVKITVVGDTAIELTFEEAKCLYNELKKIVDRESDSPPAKKESIKEHDGLKNSPTWPQTPVWPVQPFYPFPESPWPTPCYSAPILCKI